MEALIIQLTKKELQELITEAVKSGIPSNTSPSEPDKFLKGIHNLAKYLQISPSRAQKLKNEGIIPYYQNGRTLLFEPSKVREALFNYTHKTSKK